MTSKIKKNVKHRSSSTTAHPLFAVLEIYRWEIISLIHFPRLIISLSIYFLSIRLHSIAYFAILSIEISPHTAISFFTFFLISYILVLILPQTNCCCQFVDFNKLLTIWLLRKISSSDVVTYFADYWWVQVVSCLPTLQKVKSALKSEGTLLCKLRLDWWLFSTRKISNNAAAICWTRFVAVTNDWTRILS